MQTKEMLGSRVEAMMAHHIANELNLWNVDQKHHSFSDGHCESVDVFFEIKEYPDWYFAGIGSTRVCLMHNDVIYKINIPNRSFHDENDREWNNYRKMQEKLIDGWLGSAFRVAECNLYEINRRGTSIKIMAMEYVNGDIASYDDTCDVDYMAQKHFGIDDTCSGNVRYDSDGNLVIIDFSR